MAIKFAQLGCELIILDCLMMMGVCDDLEREREFVQTVKRVAVRFGVTILLVHHIEKAAKGRRGEHAFPRQILFNGSDKSVEPPRIPYWLSSTISDKLHSAGRSRTVGVEDENYDSTKRDMLLSCVKQRNGRYESAIALWQAANCRAFVARADRKIAPFDSPGRPQGRWR